MPGGAFEAPRALDEPFSPGAPPNQLLGVVVICYGGDWLREGCVWSSVVHPDVPNAGLLK
jgi:hypothetical protein